MIEPRVDMRIWEDIIDCDAVCGVLVYTIFFVIWSAVVELRGIYNAPTIRYSRSTCFHASKVLYQWCSPRQCRQSQSSRLRSKHDLNIYPSLFPLRNKSPGSYRFLWLSATGPYFPNWTSPHFSSFISLLHRLDATLFGISITIFDSLVMY